jgi:molybdopterin synthase catalytic subunit/molybdopterin synthase sulfur carrier subunit
MAIHVLFFGFAADRMRTRELLMDPEPDLSVGDVFERFQAVLGAPADRFLFSVNDEWAPRDRLLADGDALALIPPMSGG